VLENERPPGSSMCSLNRNPCNAIVRRLASAAFRKRFGPQVVAVKPYQVEGTEEYLHRAADTG
jgi:hypothetical protein